MVKRGVKFFVFWGYVIGVGVMLLLRQELVLMRDWVEIVGLVVGAGLGWVMPWFDRLAYVFILHPETQLAQYVSFYVKQRRYKQALRMINQRSREMEKLTTRSILFQAAWLMLAVFALTSVGSMFGRMMVMSLGLKVMLEEWEEFGKDKQLLKQRLFWPIKRQVSDEELSWYMYLGTGLFLWLTWILV